MKLALFTILLLAGTAVTAEEFKIDRREDRLVITHGAAPVAEYVFKDEKIHRPYFANVHAPGGIPLTRTHPPDPDKDATDHADMHPGIWMGFGDVSGNDFWRNKGRIVHERFLMEPTVVSDRISFATVSTMRGEKEETLARVMSSVILAQVPGGWRLDWKARITPQIDGFFFGDQEEMGFGVRVATPITEKSGGVVTNSARNASAKATWGQPAKWCDYSGPVDGKRAGVLLVPDPANPHPSWWHNRDYGVFVSNPFGRKAMQQGEQSRIDVAKGESYPFNHSVYLYAVDPDEKPAWERFLR